MHLPAMISSEEHLRQPAVIETVKESVTVRGERGGDMNDDKVNAFSLLKLKTADEKVGSMERKERQSIIMINWFKKMWLNTTKWDGCRQ